MLLSPAGGRYRDLLGAVLLLLHSLTPPDAALLSHNIYAYLNPQKIFIYLMLQHISSELLAKMGGAQPPKRCLYHNLYLTRT